MPALSIALHPGTFEFTLTIRFDSGISAHAIRHDDGTHTPPTPFSYTITADDTDAERQEWTPPPSDNPASHQAQNALERMLGETCGRTDNGSEPTRHAGESDLDYLRRLEAWAPELAQVLPKWNDRLANVSLRELKAAKQHGLFSWVLLGETRAANGHLVPISDLIRLLTDLEAVEYRGAVAPDWYRAVRSRTHWPHELTR